MHDKVIHETSYYINESTDVLMPRWQIEKEKIVLTT